MRSLPSLVVAGFVVLALQGCQADRLRDSGGSLRIDTDALAFGQAWVGHPLTRELTVTNTSKASFAVKVHTSAPFSTAPDVEVPGGSTVQIAVTFAPDAAGEHLAELLVEAEAAELRVALSGSAAVPPECNTSGPCTSSGFDPISGACVTSKVANGTACATTCIAAGTCAEGVCVGAFNACDDQNACTSDACSEESGCVHQDVQCAESTDPCKVSFCDPATGCGLTDAVDGTSCGDSDCVTSRVCLSGVCRDLVTPEGAECGSGSPCQPKGFCQAQQCVQPAPAPLEAEWTYSAPPGVEILFPGVVDATGAHYWLECTTTCDLVSVSADGIFRFRVPTNDRSSFSYSLRGIVLVSGNVVAVTAGRHVWGFSTQTGATLWHQNLSTLFPSVPTGSLVESGQLVEASSGRLRVRTNLYAPAPHGGLILHQAGVFAIDAATGQLEWKYVVGDYLDGLVADGAGRVWFRQYDDAVPHGSGSKLVALDGAGLVAIAWPTEWGAPVARWKDRIVQLGSALVSTVDGSEVKQLFPFEHSGYMAGGGRTPVTSKTVAFGLAAPCNACDAEVDHDVAFVGDVAFAFDPNSGSILWSALLPDLLGDPGPLYDFAASHPIATSEDTMLVAAGRWTSHWSLAEIDARGEAVFVCALEDAGDFSSPVSLFGGRWTSVRVLNGLTTTYTVASYDVGDRELPSFGWGTTAGTPSGAGRPR